MLVSVKSTIWLKEEACPSKAAGSPSARISDPPQRRWPTSFDRLNLTTPDDLKTFMGRAARLLSNQVTAPTVIPEASRAHSSPPRVNCPPRQDRSAPMVASTSRTVPWAAKARSEDV